MQKSLIEMVLSQPDTASTSFEDESQFRDLFLFTAGRIIFGVPADDAGGTVESKQPAPLPLAPAAVLGVVYARGRMLTLVDPVALTTGEPSVFPAIVPVVISLRGDQQLSLAADAIGETITISSADIDVPNDNSLPEINVAVIGTVRYAGKTVTVLEPARLFDAAVQRKDRRRRRF